MSQSTEHVEVRHAPVGDHVGNGRYTDHVRGLGDVHAVAEQRHRLEELAGLLRERHATEQIGDTAVDVEVWIEVREISHGLSSKRMHGSV